MRSIASSPMRCAGASSAILSTSCAAGQQVAFHALGQQLQRRRVGGESARAQALLQPVRQFVGTHRPHRHEHARARDRVAPLAGVLAAPLLRGHQQHRVRRRVGAVLLQRLAAVLVRAAARQPQVEQAPGGEQAERGEAHRSSFQSKSRPASNTSRSP
jgi:hypothetical protein